MLILERPFFQISYIEGISFVFQTLCEEAKACIGSATAFENQSTFDL